jgi:hypothetical protein
MFGLFDYNSLMQIAESNAETYKNASPFPHIIIDQAARAGCLELVERSFPKPEDLSWWKYDNVFEKKLAFDKVELLPSALRFALAEFNSAPFVKFLEALTGISGLIPDHNYAGGGLHQILPGGKLDVHADFNVLTHQKLRRRINAIIYLNHDWLDEYNGHLELWDKEMTKCQIEIRPIFNRLVVFNTDDTSFHGHPKPLLCPEGKTRKSLALYYYTSDLTQEIMDKRHSTLYQRRPEDEVSDEVERLRAQRAAGRIADATTKEC